MSNEHIIRCIICLEEEKKYVPNTKLFHVPCDCHLYIHSSCFRQCDSEKCIVCKKDYSEEKMIRFNREIATHYNTPYNNVYQTIFCLIYVIGFFIMFFSVGFIITLTGYGIGYFFSCINQFIDNESCDKNFFSGIHLYIGLFILGIILACRAESKDRQVDRRSMRMRS